VSSAEVAALNPSRTLSRPAVAVGIAAVIAGLGWLMFGVGGQHAGMQRLTDIAGARVDVIADAALSLSREDVAAKPDSAWQRWTARGYLSARHGDAIWVRVRLPNPGAEPLHGVLSDTSYYSDRVAAWISRDAPPGGETWRQEVSGDAQAGHAKPLWGRLAAFPLTVPAGGERTIYLRVSDGYIPHVQLAWWGRAEDFFAAQLRDVLAECICFGVLLALVLYNFVLWLRLRFTDTGFYVISAAANLVFNFIANGGLALLGVPTGSPTHELLMTGACAVAGLSVLQFARVFLGTRVLLPRTDRWLRGWRWLLLGAALGVPAMAWMTSPLWLSVVVLASQLTDAWCMGTAVAAWRAGARHARFFVAAFGLLFVVVVPTAISVMQNAVLPGVALGLLAGRTVEMWLLSFAIADRFAQTQQRLVEETEQRRAIEAAYADELKLEVRERTRELQQANADKDRMLTIVGHDLRGPLTGLMRLADGDRGELAGEVGRTGRSLLLLIEDLVLWARLRAGSRLLAVHPAGAIAVPAVALHRALAEHGQIKLIVEVPDGLHVKADLVFAQTLVRNLLGNALKFAETRVLLRAVPAAGDRVRFTVGNDGPPLPPEVAARFAAGEDQPITATGGLGLRLCREICGALGTKLKAATAADGGTEFSFVLPSAANPGADHP